MKINKPGFYRLVFIMLLSFNTVFADGYWDTYPRLKWIDEAFRLKVLANHLKEHPEKVVYISCHWTNKKDRTDMEHRLQRARRYLIKIFQISPGRVIVINGGRRDYSETILQPIERGGSPPDFR